MRLKFCEALWFVANAFISLSDLGDDGDDQPRAAATLLLRSSSFFSSLCFAFRLCTFSGG